MKGQCCRLGELPADAKAIQSRTVHRGRWLGARASCPHGAGGTIPLANPVRTQCSHGCLSAEAFRMVRRHAEAFRTPAGLRGPESVSEPFTSGTGTSTLPGVDRHLDDDGD